MRSGLSSRPATMKFQAKTGRRITAAFLLASLVLVTLLSGAAQQQQQQQHPLIAGFEDGNVTSRYRPTELPTSSSLIGEFAFVRIMYPSPHSIYNQWFGAAWRVDYPEADTNFTEGIHAWASTNLRLSQPVQIRPTDPRP